MWNCKNWRIPQVSTKLKTDRDLKNRGRGSFDYMTENNDNISVTKWFDNKCVHVASSYKGVNPIENVKRWSASEKKYIDVQRPSIIKEYNTFMGVDDMLVSLYRTKIGVKRYYFRIVFHLIDICIVNAWFLYRRDCSLEGKAKYKKLLNFRADIAHALMQTAELVTTRKRGRPYTTS